MSMHMNFARTHGTAFQAVAGMSARSTSSAASSRTHASECGVARFYATAPAPRLEISGVQEATGVRLSDDQLSILRTRFKGNEGGFGSAGPTGADLRQEIFGKMVLQPGQWPRARDTATPLERGGDHSTPARQRGGGGGLRLGKIEETPPSASSRVRVRSAVG